MSGDRICIEIASFVRSNGVRVKAHKRCYERKRLNQDQLNKIVRARRKLRVAKAKESDPQRSNVLANGQRQQAESLLDGVPLASASESDRAGKICIKIQAYTRSNGEYVSEHERCYDPKKLTDEQKERIQDAKRALLEANLAGADDNTADFFRESASVSLDPIEQSFDKFAIDERQEEESNISSGLETGGEEGTGQPGDSGQEPGNGSSPIRPESVQFYGGLGVRQVELHAIEEGRFAQVHDSWGINPETFSYIQAAMPGASVTGRVLELADPQDFKELLDKAIVEHPFGSSVSPKSIDELSGYRLFVNGDATAGLALTPEGDLVSGWSLPDPNPDRRHKLAELLVFSVEAGATTADSYDTVLPQYYLNFGFKPVSKLKWNDDVKPDNWDYEQYRNFNDGRPDYVLYAWDGGDRGTIAQRIGHFGLAKGHLEDLQYSNTWEEAAHKQWDYNLTMENTNFPNRNCYEVEGYTRANGTRVAGYTRCNTKGMTPKYPDTFDYNGRATEWNGRTAFYNKETYTDDEREVLARYDYEYQQLLKEYADEIVEASEELGGRQLSEYTSREILAMAGGLVEDSEVRSIDLNWEGDGRLGIDIYTDKYKVNRTINLAENIIEQDIFKVYENYRGQGLGLKVFSSQVDHANAGGFYGLHVGDAAKGSGWNGYYTWARFGYLPQTQWGWSGGSQRNMGSALTRALEGTQYEYNEWSGERVTTFGELFSMEGGKDWWRDNGTNFTGTFWLEEGAAVFGEEDYESSMLHLEAYWREKFGY